MISLKMHHLNAIFLIIVLIKFSESATILDKKHNRNLLTISKRI